jgi:hypothetical protein|tara:strand:- start:213 stop:359 length:147 start_codon:yes stop_codon:yes gene_type:complete
VAVVVEQKIMVVLLLVVVQAAPVCLLVDEVVEMDLAHKMVLVQQHLED